MTGVERILNQALQRYEDNIREAREGYRLALIAVRESSHDDHETINRALAAAGIAQSVVAYYTERRDALNAEMRAKGIALSPTVAPSAT